MQYRYHVKTANSADAKSADRSKTYLSTFDYKEELYGLYELMHADKVTRDDGKELTVGNNLMFYDYLFTCLRATVYPWLDQAPRDIYTYTLKNLIKAYKAFYGKVAKNHHICRKTGKLLGLPRYKSRRDHSSIQMQGFNISIQDGSISLPYSNGLKAMSLQPGRLSIRGNRLHEHECISVTISRNPSGDHSVTLVYDVPRPVLQSGKGTVGIDLTAQHNELGYAKDDTAFFKLSDLVTNLKYPIKAIEALRDRITHLQRLLSKKTVRSNTHKKLSRKIAAVHVRISNIFKNYYHHVCNILIQSYDDIIIEDLSIQDMLTNGKTNRKLNDLIQQSRLRAFRTALVDKAANRSTNTVVRPAQSTFPSTQLCSVCKTRSADKINLGVKVWTCHSCNSLHDRDYNAAANLYDLHKMVKRPETGRGLFILPMLTVQEINYFFSMQGHIQPAAI
jgi:putative transposase